MTKKYKLVTCQNCTYQHDASENLKPNAGAIWVCWQCDAFHFCDGAGGVNLADGEALAKLQQHPTYAKALAMTAFIRGKFKALGRRPTSLRRCWAPSRSRRRNPPP